MRKHNIKPSFSQLYRDLEANGENANEIFNSALRNGSDRTYTLKTEEDVKAFASESLDKSKFYIDQMGQEWKGGELAEAISKTPYAEFVYHGDTYTEKDRLIWYAVMDSKDDSEQGCGSRKLGEARKMLAERKKTHPEAYIAVISNTLKSNGIDMDAEAIDTIED